MEKKERLKKLEEKRRKEEELKRQDELKRLEKTRKEKRRKRPKPVAKKRATRTGAIFRSALLPGWGQVYQGRTSAGAAYGAGFLVLAASAGTAVKHHSWTRDQYKKTAWNYFMYTPFFFDQLGAVSGFSSSTLSQDEFRLIGIIHQMETIKARERMVDAGRGADFARSLLLGFYLWNITDALLFHPSSSSSMGFFYTPDAAAVQYTFRF